MRQTGGRSRPNYIKHARSFGRGSTKRRRTRSFSDSVASLHLPRRAMKRHNGTHSALYGKIFKCALLILIAIGWGSMPIFLPYFKISSVTYSGLGTDKDVRQNVEKTVDTALKNDAPWWPKNNYFIFDTESLRGKLLEDPRLSSAEVKKEFPHNLNVSVTEKTSKLVYFSPAGTGLVLDGDGGYQRLFFSPEHPLTVISPTSSANSTTVDLPAFSLSENQIKAIPFGLKSLPRVLDFRLTSMPSADNIATGTTYISKEVAWRITQWSDALAASNLGSLQLMRIDGNASPYRLILKTKQPWAIISDTTKDPAEQLRQVALLLKVQKPQSYIDMRFDGRLYWK